MKQGNKQNYHHGDLRAALIEATAEIINREGIESITMRRLSEWTGVSRAAPYRHFEDKAALLTATAIEGFHRFSRELKSARLDESVDELTRFKNMGQAYIRFAMENTAYYRLMFGWDVTQNCEALCTASDTAFNQLLTIIKQLQESELILCDDPKMQAVYVWSLMHGLACLIIDKKLHANLDTQAVIRLVEQQALRGLGGNGE